MFGSLFIISLAITYSSAGYSYGGGGGGGALGYAGGQAFAFSGGAGGLGLAGGLAHGLTSLGNAHGLGIAGPIGLSSPGPLSAAIQTHRTFEVIPVSLPQEPPVPQIIEVEPSEQPVQVIFRSVSSPVLVQQFHTPGEPGQVESTQSEDEPHRVVHEVLRPVIQEVREVIQPYRRVTQEVRPVLEEVHTVVAKGEGRHSGPARGLALAGGPVIGGDGGHIGLDGGPGLYGNGGHLGLSNGYKAKSRRA